MCAPSQIMASITGVHPNVTWRSVSDDHLCGHPLFTPLSKTSPSLPSGRLHPKAAIRCIPQHTYDWDSLHSGRLTTSKLAAFLGVYEASPSARLKIPRSLRGHGKAVNAFAHLGGDSRGRGAAATGRVLDKMTNGGASLNDLAAINATIAATAGLVNTDVLCSTVLQGLPLELAPESPCGRWGSHPSSSPDSRISPGPTSHLYRYRHNGSDDTNRTSGMQEQDLSRLSRVHSSMDARLQWGSEQEATAVLVALNALIGNPLRDAMSQSSTPHHKSSLTYAGEALPATGLPLHFLRRSRVYEIGLCPLEAVPLPDEELPAKDGDSLSNSAPGGEASESEGDSDSSHVDADPVLSLVPSVVALSVAAAAGAGKRGRKRRKKRKSGAAKKAQTAKSSPASLDTCFTDAAGNRWPQRSALPLMGASPDGLIVYGDGRVEVVEVKNHSPFIDNIGGGGTGPYRVSDGGPQERVGAWHIPQVQLEILCAGPQCTGANFVSLSATRGAHVFYLPRDDAYIALMLRLVASFYRTHVLGARGTPCPPADFCCSHPEYGLFLDRTQAIANAALLRAAVPHEEVQRSDGNVVFFHERAARAPRVAAPSVTAPEAALSSTNSVSCSGSGSSTGLGDSSQNPGQRPATNRKMLVPAAVLMRSNL